MNANITISPKMLQVNKVMIDHCEGVNHCISILGKNLVVEAPRDDCEKVVSVLKRHFEDVVDIRKAYLMISDLHDFILVKPMISEAPLSMVNGIPVPSAEKHLVDLFSDKEYNAFGEAEKVQLAKRDIAICMLNQSKIMRYARRKGKKEEMEMIMKRLMPC